MSADIVELPDPNEVIPQDTLIPVLDAPAEVIARRLKDRSWEARTRFFNNIIVGSLEVAGKMLPVLEPSMSMDGPMSKDGLFTGIIVATHEKVANTLDLWPAPDPMTQDAAELYLVSMSPEHRALARRYFEDRRIGHLDQIKSPGLYTFQRLSEAMHAGLTELWYRKEQGCSCDGEPEDGGA